MFAGPGSYDDHTYTSTGYGLLVRGVGDSIYYSGPGEGEIDEITREYVREYALNPIRPPCQEIDRYIIGSLYYYCGIDSDWGMDDGRTVFDVSHWTSSSSTRMIRVWAEFYSGIHGGGYAMTVCTDLDDNFYCGEGESSATTYSNPNFGLFEDPCKDASYCEDASVAEAYLCVPKDNSTGGNDWDNIYAYFDWWVDEGVFNYFMGDGENSGTGYGFATGVWDVYLEYQSYYSTESACVAALP